jgi:hypothetical protein
MTENNDDQRATPSGDNPTPPEFDPDVVYDIITPEPTQLIKGSSGGKVAAGVVGVGLLAAGSLFALTQFSATDGGGSSPKAAVESLLDAVGDEDIIGVLEALSPAERNLLVDPVQRTSDELARIGILPDDIELTGISGIDFEFEGLEYQVVMIRDDIATVEVVAGSLTTRVTGDELPVGPLVNNVAERFGQPIDIPDTTATSDIGAGSETKITTIKRNGSWYISIGYSIAEAARIEAKEDITTAGERIPTNGQASPEAAGAAMVQAFADLDLEAMVGVLPPDLFEALYDYGPSFIPEAQRALDAAADGAVDITISDLQLSSRIDGDRALVFVDGIEIEISAFGESVSAAFKDGCGSVTMPDGTMQEACTKDAAGNGLPEGMELLQPLVDRLSEIEFGLTTVKVDGEWYSAPIHTSIDVGLSMLGAIEPDDITTVADGIDTLAESFMGLADEQFGAVGETVDFG